MGLFYFSNATFGGHMRITSEQANYLNTTLNYLQYL